jgi:hypothetical protein
MLGERQRKLRVGLVGAVALLVLAVPLAAAAELSRDEYVARVEPICKANVEANRKIFKGAKEQVKAGELKKGSTHFFRAATALEKTIGQLQGVPKPPADVAKLDRWIDYLKTEAALFRKIGRALAAGDKYGAENLSVKLNRNTNLANNTILAFGFDYCRIDSSRFA